MATADEFLFGGAPPKPTAPAPPKKPQTADEFLFGPKPEAKPEEPPQEPLSTTENVLLTGLRVVPPTIAGLGGPLVSVPVGAGSEYLAQKYEVHRGARKEVSPGGVAVAGAVSAIPGAKLESLAARPILRFGARVGEGALIGGGATTATTLAEEGRLPTADEFLFGAATGGAFGTVGGTVEAVTGRGRAAPRAKPAVGDEGAAVGVKPVVEGAPEVSVAGEPAPKPAAEAPAPPPKPTRVEPEPQQMQFEQPSFRKVPGLHEAAFGEKPTAARPRDPERLAGEIDAVDRQYAHLPESSRTILKQVKVDMADDTAWRARETQPVQRTKDLADELVFDPEVAAKKARGQAWKAEEYHAAGSHIADLLDDMQPLAEHVAANPDDLTAQLRLQKKQTELVASVTTFEGAKAETGRALNILKYQMTALKKGDPGLIKAALRRGANADAILKIMRLPTDAEKMKALVALHTPTKLETFRSFWMSNLLAGPKTLIRNTIGNTLPPALDIVTTPFAAGVEKLRGVPLAERQTFAGEIPAKFQSLRTQKIGGMQFGLREALRQASDVFHTGYEPGNPIWEQLPQQQWSERVFPNVSPGVRTALEYPGRALAATDKFFRTLNYHMDLFGGAYAQARRELGAQADRAAVQQRMTDILSRPSPELLANAERNAQRRVYQEHGKLDEWLMKGRDFGPMGFVIPFVRTPVAIVRQGFQLTPAGFLSRFHGKAPTARMSAQIRGEAAFGTLLMGGLAAGVMDGKIKVHGTGPDDPVERDKFYRMGGRPNSIEILGHSVGYSQLGPLAQPISLIANYFDAYQDAVAKGDVQGAQNIAQQAAVQGGIRAVKSIKDQSFVRGLSDLNNALSDPGRYGQRFIGGILAGAVPYSGAVRSVTQATDPTLRQAETPLEYVQTQLPTHLLPESIRPADVPPRLRATGEPIQIEQAGGAWGRALLPTDVAPIQPSPVERELDTHNVRLTFPEGQVRVMVKGPEGKEKSEPLSREDETAVAQAKGQATMRQLEKLIATPSYQSARPEVQAKRLEAVIDRVRAAVHRRAVVTIHQKRPLTIEGLIPPGVAAGREAR